MSLSWALLFVLCVAATIFAAYWMVVFALAAVLRTRAGLTQYQIERASSWSVDEGALAIAILGAGFHVEARRRRLHISRIHGRDRAIVRLPWSRVLGAAPLAIESTDRDLVLGLMTAMSTVLGALRLHTPELGEVLVTPPSAAASPDAPRAWADVRQRGRVASHYALDERWRRPGRR
jgi:hypothetical protein